MGRRKPNKPVGLDDLDLISIDEAPREGFAAVLHRPASPTAGMRLATSYALMTCAAIIGVAIPAGIVSGLYAQEQVCRGSDSFSCPILLMFSVSAVATLLVVGLGAWWLRLGLAWFVLAVGLCSFVMMMSALDPFSSWTLVYLAIPAITAVVTDPDITWQPRIRYWGSIIVGTALLIWFATETILAGR